MIKSTRCQRYDKALKQKQPLEAAVWLSFKS